MRLERTIAVLVLATGVMCAGAALAAEQLVEATPPAAAPPAPPVPQGLPDTKYPPGQKGEAGANPWAPTDIKPEHAILARLAGKFTTRIHLYQGLPSRKPEIEGTAEGKLLMGGAFVQFNHSEPRTKAPFEAMSIYGYDQATRKYTASSIESSSTAIATFIGTYDAAKKQLVLTGRYSDQKTHVLTIIRRVITFVDATSFTIEDFESHKAGDPETPLVSILFKS
jgi:hypothetical protein